MLPFIDNSLSSFRLFNNSDIIARYFVSALNWLVRKVVLAVIGGEVREVSKKRKVLVSIIAMAVMTVMIPMTVMTHNDI